MILDAVRQHYLTLWGEPSRVLPRHTKDYHIDVYRWDATITSSGLTQYATVGASAFPQPGWHVDHRFEFYAGLLPQCDAIATVLADVSVYSVKEQAPIGPTHTITWRDEPLWPETQMCSIVLDRSSVDLVPMLGNTGEGVHVEFLSVTPLYPSELQFKKDHSWKALIEHWRLHGVHFWDPNRLPEPV